MCRCICALFLLWHCRVLHRVSVTGTYDFQRDATDAEVVKRVTQQDIIDYWDKTFDANARGRRKLSSQVIPAHLSMPDKKATGIGGRPMHYVDGVEEMVQYKRTLTAYPTAPRFGAKW